MEKIIKICDYCKVEKEAKNTNQYADTRPFFPIRLYVNNNGFELGKDQWFQFCGKKCAIQFLQQLKGVRKFESERT